MITSDFKPGVIRLITNSQFVLCRHLLKKKNLRIHFLFTLISWSPFFHSNQYNSRFISSCAKFPNFIHVYNTSTNSIKLRCVICFENVTFCPKRKGPLYTFYSTEIVFTNDSWRFLILEEAPSWAVSVSFIVTLRAVASTNVNVLTSSINKPGTAQVGAISKAQKDSKTTFSTTGDNKSSQKTKN